MKERDNEVLSEEEAARVWQLSAQLQAEASDGSEERPVSAEGEGGLDTGYALTHVRSAAEEAGIADHYVEAAIVQLRAERALSQVARGHSVASRFLGRPPNTMTVTRVIEASPQEVLDTMKVVLLEERFRLTLVDQQGDPTDGGVLVFDFPAMKTAFERGFAFETTDGGLRQAFVSLRPVDGANPSCEITLHSPVTSHNTGFGLGMVATVLGAGALGAVGLATGLGPIAMVGGGLLGAGLGVTGFRGLYGTSMRRSRKALEGLVDAVATRTKGVW